MKITTASLLLTTAAVAFLPKTWAQEASLEEIVVTAERREANLQETPISIVAFSEVDLQEMGIHDVEDLQAFVPNVSIGGSGTSANLVDWHIRGIGSNQNEVGHDRGVGLYVDDVYFSQPVNSLLNVLDLERVEVLRGPQGTLFGRNTTGGAVRYVTRKPTNEFEANITGTVGSLNRTDIKGIVNVPFSDTVYGRFTAASLSQDGWITQRNGQDDLGNRDDQMIRAQIRVEPNDALTFDFTLDHVSYTNDGAAQFMLNPIPTADAPMGQWYTTYQANNLAADPSVVIPNFIDVVTPTNCDVSLECSIPGTGADEFTDGDTTIGSAVVQWAVSDTLTFKSVTSYLTLETREINDWDLSVVPVFTVGQPGEPDTRKWEESSQEFLLTGTGWDDRLDWTAGLYFSEADGSRNVPYVWIHPMGMGNLVRHDRSYNAETANQAVFFDATARLSEQFAVSAGVRYTQDDKSFWGFRTDRQGGQIFSEEHDWSDTIGRLVLEYFPRDGIMLYASLSEGYKAGFIADQIVPSPAVPNGGVFPFNQENVETVELGLRSEWWDNRLRFNLTLFDTAYTDMQVDALTQVPSAGGTTEPVRFTSNAGDVDFDGWEMDLLFAATENLRFDLSIGKLNHEIVKLDPTVSFASDGAMPRAPEDSWKVGVRYDVPLSNGGNVRLGLDHGFTDTQFSGFGDTNVIWMPEYELTNARVTYAEPNGRWTAALFCTNCSDEWYIRGVHDNQRQWGGSDTLIGKPRMYGVEFSMDF